LNAVITTVPDVERGFFPLDKQLDLWEKHWSEQIAKQTVWLSGLVPFAQVEQILHEVGRINISQSSAWRLVNRWGGKLQAIEAIQRASPLEFDEMETYEPNHSLERMGAAMDGTMIHIREEGWKELKVGCVFDIEQNRQFDPQTQEESELCSAIHNSYVAHLGGPAIFGRQLWAEAHQRHWTKAKETVILGDGATWIWNLADKHFYKSHQLVDWYHATEHLNNASKTLYGEGSPIAKRWYRHWETKLYLGHVDQLVRSMKNHIKQQPHKGEALRKEAGYFQNNRKRMNYLDLRNEGYPIGSGMVESAGKQYKARFCGAGMHWSRNGAENLMPIRTAILSNRFDTAWRLTYNSPPI